MPNPKKCMEADNREVSHQYEYDNDNEHVIKSFIFVFILHIKWVSTESRRKLRLDSKDYLNLSGINAWTMCICSDSKELQNQIVLHFQGEHVHKSKKINQIMFVWNVRKWKPILVDAKRLKMTSRL
jgi:hypothetical protein